MHLKNLISNLVFKEPLSSIPAKRKCIINTINPHSYCEAKKDKVFTEALLSSDVLLPDGSGIVLATKILTGNKISKIAGADIHQYLLEQANLKEQKVFYLGASVSTLKLIEERIQKDFPNIIVANFSPPFKPQFSNKDTHTMIEKINAFQPDILFVGMTAPKQEKWVYANYKVIKASTIVSIGAVFDFYAGTVKRSSPIWIQLGLEWLPRLVRDPKRLWKRNFISTPKFLIELASYKIFGKGVL
jgi:N-acetylglucosaminyldiphosphoundecaprenol N-acetyl-beta-D-mannosaminyltransferase